MRILFSFLLAIAFLGANAQQINGIANDQDGKPVSGATVSLLADTGKKVIKLAVSKDNGAYSFTNIKEGKYRLSFSHVAYQPAVSAPFEVSGAEVNAPAIKLTKAAGNLKDVTVTAKKPIVEVKADKTVLNVEGTINAIGTDALELLRKSPGVMVDKDDNLSLSAKSGVKVYVDGREVPLSGADLANYLKSIQSTNIESIELITNPSAKYEAAGNAGIINIRLKKNKSLGTNGSVNAGYNIGTYAKYNGGLSLNYRNQKVNLFGTYNYNNGSNINHLNLYRTVLDSAFDQRSEMVNNSNVHSYKVGMDYFISKKSIIGAMANGIISHPTMTNYSKTPISYVPTNTVNRILVADNSGTMKRNNINLNLNYSYNTTDGKSLTVNADHGVYDFNSDQYQPNYYYDPTGQILQSSVIYRMIAPTDITINSIKVDWEQNFQKGRLGFGGKTGYVETDNDFQRYNVINGADVLDKDRSNRFRYNENINAGYINYNRQFKGIMVQAGLRVENTVSEGTSTGLKYVGSEYKNYDSSFKRNYTDLFPSAAVTFNKNPMNAVSISYSRRIDRPAYQDLNPFEFRLDEYTFQKGNINLRPQYTNSISVTHTYKYRLNSTLNYSHVKDMFVMLPDTVEGSKAFLSKKNLASQDILSFNVSYPFSYKSYSVFANINTNYSMYKADYGAGREVDAKAFGFSFFAQNSLKFAKTWTAELSGFYNAPTIWQGAFRARAIAGIDGGFQKQVMQGKGTIKASVSDIFHTLHFKGESDFAGQKANVDVNWESRQFKLAFVYRFGRSQIKAARQHSTSAEEENKRTQGGNGGIGIGQ